MPSRQFHTKSRHGCAQCKQRHVRCDLGRPSCSRCVKKRIDCEFTGDAPCSRSRSRSASPAQAAAAAAAASSPGPASPSPRCLTPLGTSPLDASLRVLEIVNHYVYYVGPNLSAMPSVKDAYVYMVPSLAHEQTWMSSGLLSFAALDLYTLRPHRDPHLLELSRAYHVAALAAMRAQLAQASSLDALFALSSFIFGYTQALPVAETVDLFDNTRTLARLLKGTASITRSHADWFRNSGLSALRALQALPESEAGAIQTPGGADAVERLRQWNEAAPGPMQQAYRAAIDALGKRLRAVESQDLNMGMCSMWLLSVDDDFFDRVDRGDALALAILAVFGVIQWKVRRWHWIGDRGERLLRGIEQRLGPERRACIAWPLSMVDRESAKI